MACAGLAYSIGRLPDFGASASENIPKSNAAALKAIELDPTLARPHVTLGANKMAHEWDFTGGLAEFKKAVELDPNSADGHEVYAENLGLLGGREQEAIAEANPAHELDPLSPSAACEETYTLMRDGSTTPLPSAKSWQIRILHSPRRTLV